MTAESPRFKRAVRLGLSVLVIWHLVAVFAPPLAFQTRGPVGDSPSVGTMLMPVRAYGQMLYIDRGYAFFAPDPGPSHLIQAAITDASGERREVMFPDLEVHWPRLKYHRHFMLAEYLTEIHQPPGPPPELEEAAPREARFWRQARFRYEYVRKSMVDHLSDEHPGHEVAIRRIEHLIPGFQDDSIELTDPQLYTVLLDQPMVVGGEMELPSGPPEAIPAPADQAIETDEAKGTPGGETKEPKALPLTQEASADSTDESAGDASPASEGETPEPDAGNKVDAGNEESTEQDELTS